jgi:O-Antigen ligase
MQSWRIIVMVVFVSGILVTGLLGTSTAMTFAWPGYLLLGAAAIGAMGLLFCKVTFAVPRYTLLLALVALGYLAIRATDSPVTYLARADIALALSGLMTYAVFLTVAQRWDLRLCVILTLAFLTLAHLVAAAWQTWIEPTFWLLPGYVRSAGEKSGGFFYHHGHFVGYLAMLVPLWVALGVVGRVGRSARMAWLALALLSAAVVSLSENPVGLVTMLTGLIALGLLLTWITWKRMPHSLRYSLIGGIAFLTLSGASAALWQREPITNLANKTIFVRSDGANLPWIWNAGWRQFTESPMIGTGSRSSVLYGTRFRSPHLAPEVEDSGFIENEVLQLLADYGLAGLGFLIIVLGCHLVIGLRFVQAYARSDTGAGCLPRSQHLALAVGAISVLSGMFMLGQFSAAWHLPIMLLTAAIFLAVLATPDPTARILQNQTPEALPGGGSLFLTRAVAFAGGIALLICGQAYIRSEYHLERANQLAAGNRDTFHIFRHLQTARDLDSKNPQVYTLSGRLHFGALTPEMGDIARRDALAKSAHYFEQALRLHPHDPAATLGQVAALEELGESDRSALRLADAKIWAPLSAKVRLAEAKHHLRRGEILLAETAYQSALEATMDCDDQAARLGLDSLARWRDIALAEGWPIQDESTVAGATSGKENEASVFANRMAATVLPEANVISKTLSGSAETPSPPVDPITDALVELPDLEPTTMP